MKQTLKRTTSINEILHPKPISLTRSLSNEMLCQHNILKPCIEKIIYSIAVIIYDKIINYKKNEYEEISWFFSELNNQLQKNIFNICTSKRMCIEKVNLKDIYSSLIHICQNSKLDIGCFIVALIYVERLNNINYILNIKTWKSIFLTALIVSQKYLFDNYLDLQYFCEFTMFRLHEFCSYEAKFLEIINWNTIISPKLYAQYYFKLSSNSVMSQLAI